MPDVTIISENSGEAIPSASEAVITTETVEAVADSAVEIARIEAERDIAIAEVRAETEETLAETSVEIAAQSEELTEWQRNSEARIASLEAANLALQSTLEQLTVQAPLPTNQQETQPDDAAAMPESLEAPREVEKAKRRTRFRLI